MIHDDNSSVVLRRAPVLSIVFATVLLLGLPQIGVWLGGLPVKQYLEFPPLTVYRTPAPFSWIAVAIIFAFQFPLWVPVIALASRLRATGFKLQQIPRWGWLALAWTGTWWIVTWTRFPCFAFVQHHTYTPLWLGYIAFANAMTFARTGRCMLTHAPQRLARLFAASGFFWWFFEYLNRFVQNWFYLGIENFGRLEYFVFATLAFSTVLPAVISTAEMLDSFLPANGPLQILGGTPVRATGSGAIGKVSALGGLVLACIALAGIGVWPDYFYPFIWLAPLIVLTTLKSLRGGPTIFSDAMRGDWRRLAVLSLAALICGFFWEMWNFNSLAKWEYLVPFVGVWKVFEMPLLGFAGYLPFGWECAVIADAIVIGASLTPVDGRAVRRFEM
jgi:hypothetical protein